jgi:hypothetical protein
MQPQELVCPAGQFQHELIVCPTNVDALLVSCWLALTLNMSEDNTVSLYAYEQLSEDLLTWFWQAMAVLEWRRDDLVKANDFFEKVSVLSYTRKGTK